MTKNHGFRLLLRAWIAIASLAAFVGGWVFIGHSGKPVSASDAGQSLVEPLPTLAPLPSSNGGSSVQPFSQPSSPVVRPRFRTRGS